MKPSEHLKESARQIRNNIGDQQRRLKEIDGQIRTNEESTKQLRLLYSQTSATIEQLNSQIHTIEQQANEQERKEREESSGIF